MIARRNVQASPSLIVSASDILNVIYWNKIKELESHPKANSDSGESYYLSTTYQCKFVRGAQRRGCTIHMTLDILFWTWAELEAFHNYFSVSIQWEVTWVKVPWHAASPEDSSILCLFSPYLDISTSSVSRPTFKMESTTQTTGIPFYVRWDLWMKLPPGCKSSERESQLTFGLLSR